jgi:hypothetical protein
MVAIAIADFKAQRVVCNCPAVFDEGYFDGVVVKVFGWHRGSQRTSGSIVLQRLGFAMVVDQGGADSFGEAIEYGLGVGGR